MNYTEQEDGPICYESNSDLVDYAGWWDQQGPSFDPEWKIWYVSAVCVIITTVACTFNIVLHLRNFWRPEEQKQVVRILLLPIFYGLASFLGYRWYREYTYFSLFESAYVSLAISAYLFLLLAYVGPNEEAKRKYMETKERARAPAPLCCLKMTPTKSHFLFTLRLGVLQYSVIAIVEAIIAALLESQGLLCDGSFSYNFASVYLKTIDMLSISVAFIMLLMLYNITKKNLRKKRPLFKFVCIKLVVFLSFYQTYLCSILARKGVIKPGTYWTSRNVSNSLSCLLTIVELVPISIAMIWAFSWKDYRADKGIGEHTSVLSALGKSLNFGDFVKDFGRAIKFHWKHAQGRSYNTYKSDRYDLEDRDVGQRYETSGVPRGAFDRELSVADPQPRNGARTGRQPSTGPRTQGKPKMQQTAYFDVRPPMGQRNPSLADAAAPRSRTTTTTSETPYGQRSRSRSRTDPSDEYSPDPPDDAEQFEKSEEMDVSQTRDLRSMDSSFATADSRNRSRSATQGVMNNPSRGQTWSPDNPTIPPVRPPRSPRRPLAGARSQSQTGEHPLAGDSYYYR